jgi:hypothetical protein
MMVIPLKGGSVNAHQQITIQLGDNLLTFSINYLQSGQWSADIEREGVSLITGAMLEPNADLTLTYPALNIGSLVFTGSNTTLDNLGSDNRLTWVAP